MNQYSEISRGQVGHPSRYSRNPARVLVSSLGTADVLLIIVHAFVLLLFWRITVLMSVHAYFVFGLAFYFALVDETPHRLIFTLAYIVGFDVIWRGGNTLLFWEAAKYGVIFTLVIRMLKNGKFKESSKLSLVYAILLIPSVAILPYFDRSDVSFNVSGGVALGVATWFFSTVTLTMSQLKRMLYYLVLPSTALSLLIVAQIFRAGEVTFQVGRKANSAGIGPNQVSSVLAVGFFAAFFFFILENKPTLTRVFMILYAMGAIVQSAITSSRGGFYTAILAAMVAILYVMRSPRSKVILVVFSLALFWVGTEVVIPYMDELSNQGFSERLQDTGLSGRDLIIQADLIAFQENPIFGLGPGQSYDFHAITFRPSHPHTEYSRLLAEHGSFGAVALIIMIVLSISRGITRRENVLLQGFVVSCTMFVLLYMGHSAMRLAAPAFMFGLAAANFVNDPVDAELLG